MSSFWENLSQLFKIGNFRECVRLLNKNERMSKGIELERAKHNLSICEYLMSDKSENIAEELEEVVFIFDSEVANSNDAFHNISYLIILEGYLVSVMNLLLMRNARDEIVSQFLRITEHFLLHFFNSSVKYHHTSESRYNLEDISKEDGNDPVVQPPRKKRKTMMDRTQIPILLKSLSDTIFEGMNFLNSLDTNGFSVFMSCVIRILRGLLFISKEMVNKNIVLTESIRIITTISTNKSLFSHLTESAKNQVTQFQSILRVQNYIRQLGNDSETNVCMGDNEEEDRILEGRSDHSSFISNKTSLTFLFLKGYQFFTKNDFEKARKYFEKTSSSIPESQMYLSSIAFSEGRINDSILHLHSILRKKSSEETTIHTLFYENVEKVAAMNNLCAVYCRSGQSKSYFELRKLQFQYLSSQKTKDMIAQTEDDSDDGYLSQTLEKFPNHLEVMYELVRQGCALGYTKFAADGCEFLINEKKKRSVDLEDVYLVYIYCLICEGDYDTAMSLLSNLDGKGDNDEERRMSKMNLRMECLLRSRNSMLSAGLLEESISTLTKERMILDNLDSNEEREEVEGENEDDEEEEEEGGGGGKKTKNMKFLNREEKLNNAALLSLVNGDCDNALKMLDLAVSNDPSDITTRYNLCLLLYKVGNCPQACVRWLKFRNIRHSENLQDYFDQMIEKKRKFQVWVKEESGAMNQSSTCVSEKECLLLDIEILSWFIETFDDMNEADRKRILASIEMYNNITPEMTD